VKVKDASFETERLGKERGQALSLRHGALVAAQSNCERHGA
jgi:hypothetical protein